eukprot:678624-Pyramimonas_sp.AAC.1
MDQSDAGSAGIFSQWTSSKGTYRGYSRTDSGSAATSGSATSAVMYAKGYSVDAKGYSVDAKGYSVNAKGSVATGACVPVCMLLCASHDSVAEY